VTQYSDSFTATMLWAFFGPGPPHHPGSGGVHRGPLCVPQGHAARQGRGGVRVVCQRLHRHPHPRRCVHGTPSFCLSIQGYSPVRCMSQGRGGVTRGLCNVSIVILTPVDVSTVPPSLSFSLPSSQTSLPSASPNHSHASHAAPSRVLEAQEGGLEVCLHLLHFLCSSHFWPFFADNVFGAWAANL